VLTGAVSPVGPLFASLPSLYRGYSQNPHLTAGRCPAQRGTVECRPDSFSGSPRTWIAQHRRSVESDPAPPLFPRDLLVLVPQRLRAQVQADPRCHPPVRAMDICCRRSRSEAVVLPPPQALGGRGAADWRRATRIVRQLGRSAR
jgi:hypothetical protein